MSNLLLLVACLAVGVLLQRSARTPANAHQALNAVILHVSLPAATLQEALDAHRRPSLQLAIVDRTMLAIDLDAWRTRRVADERRRLPMILTSMAPDDPAIEQFGRSAAASLTAPLGLEALNAAVQATVAKECV